MGVFFVSVVRTDMHLAPLWAVKVRECVIGLPFAMSNIVPTIVKVNGFLHDSLSRPWVKSKVSHHFTVHPINRMKPTFQQFTGLRVMIEWRMVVFSVVITKSGRRWSPTVCKFTIKGETCGLQKRLAESLKKMICPEKRSLLE
jgi:hypothetical protein